MAVWDILASDKRRVVAWIQLNSNNEEDLNRFVQTYMRSELKFAHRTLCLVTKCQHYINGIHDPREHEHINYPEKLTLYAADAIFADAGTYGLLYHPVKIRVPAQNQNESRNRLE